MSILPDNPDIRKWLFALIKYATYGILAYNGYMFYLGESDASGTTFSDGMTFAQVIEVYSATIDTTFWILLVILMELETYIIPDETLRKPAVKWTMIGLRTISYLMIVYALYGYSVKFAFQADIIPLSIANVCELLGRDYSIMLEFETYAPLAPDNCQLLNGQVLGQLNGHRIIAPMDDLIYARNVAAIDVFNASAWLGVVLVLEMDFWFQLKGTYKGKVLKVSNTLKGIFYTILFACAFAWGYTGVWLDIVDAMLWLFAFFFIEMNLLQWQEETREAEAPA